MSDPIEKKEKSGNVVEKLKRTFNKGVEMPVKSETPDDPVKTDVPSQPLEEPKADEPSDAVDSTKMVEPNSVVLDDVAMDAGTHRKYGAVMAQKPVGVQKYFRSKKK